MKPRRVCITLACAAALCIAPLSFAQPADDPAPAPAPQRTPALQPGDPAPTLSVESWLIGQPVAAFQPGRVYVIEFWATWCTPCIAAIPHLTRLQQQLAGKVTIIGVSSSTEGLATVEAFVDKRRAQMGYTVAFDADRSMADAWMKAAGRPGIPCSFIVDQQGRIAWIGHPRVGLDTIVHRVVAGTFDPAAWLVTESKAAQLRARALTAARASEFDPAAAALDDLAALDPIFAADAGLMKFAMLLRQKKDLASASAAAESLIAGPLKDDSDSLRQVAAAILDTDGIAAPELDAAIRAAQRAFDVERGENPPTIATLARAHWLKGDKPKAIELQRRALELATDDSQKRELAATLRRYEGK